MTTVFVVERGEYSDFGWEAVFSTRETAERYVRVVSALRSDTSYRVVETELDAPQSSWTCLVVEMKKDGTVVDTDTIVETLNGEGYNTWMWALFTRARASAGWAIDPETTTLRCAVRTDSVERAIKVVNERRTWILTQGLWAKEDEIRAIRGQAPPEAREV